MSPLIVLCTIIFQIYSVNSYAEVTQKKPATYNDTDATEGQVSGTQNRKNIPSDSGYSTSEWGSPMGESDYSKPYTSELSDDSTTAETDAASKPSEDVSAP